MTFSARRQHQRVRRGSQAQVEPIDFVAGRALQDEAEVANNFILADPVEDEGRARIMARRQP